jgi:hypothetical protein
MAMNGMLSSTPVPVEQEFFGVACFLGLFEGFFGVETEVTGTLELAVSDDFRTAKVISAKSPHSLSGPEDNWHSNPFRMEDKN